MKILAMRLFSKLQPVKVCKKCFIASQNLYHLIEFHVNQNAYFVNLKNPFFPPTDITITYLYRIVVTLLS